MVVVAVVVVVLVVAVVVVVVVVVVVQHSRNSRVASRLSTRRTHTQSPQKVTVRKPCLTRPPPEETYVSLYVNSCSFCVTTCLLKQDPSVFAYDFA